MRKLSPLGLALEIRKKHRTLTEKEIMDMMPEAGLHADDDFQDVLDALKELKVKVKSSTKKDNKMNKISSLIASNVVKVIAPNQIDKKSKEKRMVKRSYKDSKIKSSINKKVKIKAQRKYVSIEAILVTVNEFTDKVYKTVEPMFKKAMALKTIPPGIKTSIEKSIEKLYSDLF